MQQNPTCQHKFTSNRHQTTHAVLIKQPTIFILLVTVACFPNITSTINDAIVPPNSEVRAIMLVLLMQTEKTRTAKPEMTCRSFLQIKKKIQCKRMNSQRVTCLQNSGTSQHAPTDRIYSPPSIQVHTHYNLPNRLATYSPWRPPTCLDVCRREG
jgi:hypothetical protein